MKTFQFDVFLSHNRLDKARVRPLAKELNENGLRVWLDEWMIRQGDDIYLAIEQGLETSRCLVLCISPAALGSDWVSLERTTVLFRDPTNKERRFIPLLLADCVIPDALRRYKCVDYRDQNESTLKDLLSACLPPAQPTGYSFTPGQAVGSPLSLAPPTDAPSRTRSQSGLRETLNPAVSGTAAPSAARAGSGSETTSVTQRRCKLSCKETSYDSLHLRNASFLTNLCRRFPNTNFRILRQSTTPEDDSESFNPKNVMELVIGRFEHGEVVTLEVSGDLQAMAAEFFKVAWENLEGYSDNIVAARARLINLIDQTWARIFADLEGAGWDRISFIAEEQLPAQEEEHRCIAIINDRLHNLSLPMIPLIAKHFGCRLQTSFEVPEKGIYSFTMEPSNNFELNKRILELEIGAGNRGLTGGSAGVDAPLSGSTDVARRCLPRPARGVAPKRCHLHPRRGLPNLSSSRHHGNKVIPVLMPEE